jgi:hypothetical protein
MMSRNNILKTVYTQVDPYITKDSSTIREFMHPAVHGNLHLSLAGARFPPGCATLLHVHEIIGTFYSALNTQPFYDLTSFRVKDNYFPSKGTGYI